MKRLLFLFFFIPQLIFAQYQSLEFTPSRKQNTIISHLTTRFVKDSIIALDIKRPVSGLFISGSASWEKDDESFVRVILTDRNNSEHLVYEVYPLLAESNPCLFSEVGIETKLLDNVMPSSLKVETHNASIQIDSIYFADAQGRRTTFSQEKEHIRRAQTRYVADILNTHLKERQIPWYAGVTSIASKTFEEKKQIFGPRVPCLYGFDYYKGGLYIMGSKKDVTRIGTQPSLRDNSFVRDFDWRNRHGKNWITSVKDQGNYSTCWAHATVATIESNFNIYYNRIIPDSLNNLSEQELVSCLDNDNQSMFQRLFYGGRSMYALDYVQRNGIVREECFPYMGLASCESKCNNPTEQVSFSAFRNLYSNNLFDDSAYVYTSDIADSLRRAVIQAPVVVDYFKLGGHSISCVGFHQIQMGDTLCGNINTSYYFVVDSARIHFVDKICWIIKNSWGDDWGDNGYARATFETVSLRPYKLSPPLTSIIYTDADRLVTDEDMDGYYTWGSGAKPSNLPVWIPNEQDGDDTNPTIGPIDEYGNCATLTEIPAITWTINSSVSHSVSDNYTYPHVIILQNGILTINGSTLMMKSNSTIRVKNGGKLILNGGLLSDANIVVENGGTLIINNGGIIRLRQDGQFLTEVGAIISINQGRIE